MRLSAYRKWMVNLGSLENQHDWGVGNMGLKNGGGSGGYQGEEYRSSHTVRAGYQTKDVKGVMTHFQPLHSK